MGNPRARREPTTGLYCVNCAEAQERTHKGKPCKYCGTLQFILGLVYIDWALLVTDEDVKFLRTMKIKHD